MSWLFKLELDTTMILYDHQSCIKMTKNPVFHDRSKHIEIRCFYIRDMMQKGAIKLQYMSTNEQVVDVLTKPLSQIKFEHFRDKLGVVQKDLPQKGSSDVTMGLYHPWTLALKWYGDLSLREWRGIVSSWDICPEVIPRAQSSRMKWDCIIPGHLL